MTFVCFCHPYHQDYHFKTMCFLTFNANNITNKCLLSNHWVQQQMLFCHLLKQSQTLFLHNLSSQSLLSIFTRAVIWTSWRNIPPCNHQNRCHHDHKLICITMAMIILIIITLIMIMITTMMSMIIHGWSTVELLPNKKTRRRNSLPWSVLFFSKIISMMMMMMKMMMMMVQAMWYVVMVKRMAMTMTRMMVVIHSKSEKIGGANFIAKKNWQKKVWTATTKFCNKCAQTANWMGSA